MGENKICNKCGIEKPLSKEFFKFRKDRDKFSTICKECENKRQRETRKKPIPNEKYKYTCLNCGEDYLAKTKDRDKFCSKECAYHYKSKNAKTDFTQIWYSNCDVCGKKTNYGTRYCSDECRNSYEHKCTVCKKKFKGTEKSICCSDECKKEYNNLKFLYNAILNYIPDKLQCKCCGNTFYTQYGDKHRLYCSDECQKQINKRSAKATRRARIYGNNYESFDPFYVFNRDKWTCQICEVKTPKHLRGTYEDNAPELDHIIPLAKGGEHTIQNTQCLCRKCNQVKSDKIIC